MELEKHELLLQRELSTDFKQVSCLQRALVWWVFPLMRAFLTSPLSPEALMNLPRDFLEHADRFAYCGKLGESLRKAFLWGILKLGLQGVVLSILNFLLPLYIVYIQYFIENDRSVWEGLGSLAIVGAGMVLKALLSAHQDLRILQYRLLFKTIVQELIYTSALRLREGLSVGQSVNVMQVDAACVFDCVSSVVSLLYYPFHFAFAIVLLSALLGWAAVVGIMCFLALFLFNYYVEKNSYIANLSIMKARDERMKHTAELLTNIRPLKMLTWEDALLARVLTSRQHESEKISTYMKLRIAVSSISLTAPALVSMIVLVSYVFLFGKELTVTVAFGTLSTMFLLQVPMRDYPTSISDVNQALAAANRIDAFLNRETVSERVSGCSTSAISLVSSTFSHSAHSEAVLHDISLEITRGEFLAVVGPVGCGKSSLLKGILGELNQLSGKTEVNGSVAFSGSIDSWILNASIKENITIGRQFDPQRYQRVLECCALLSDLQSLPAGDMTEIGERGINLSGGQKARIALARSVYADADIYLLDDPLGAVDAHVRNHIFQHCFLGLLKSKTRVLVTHSVEYLGLVNRTVSLEKGKIAQIDIPTEVGSGLIKPEVVESSVQSSGGRLVKDEERPHGDVKWSVYKEYFRYSGGAFFMVLMIISVLGWVSTRIGADLALKSWGETLSQRSMLCFVVLSVSVIFFLALRTTFQTLAAMRAANEVHSRALTAVVRAPVNTFFDVTPMGRILNRLSKDMKDIDVNLPFNFGGVVTTYANFGGIFVMSMLFVPWIVFIVPVLLWLTQHSQRYYLAGASNTSRMLRNANSPLVQHFTETLAGLKFIRSLNLQKQSAETNRTLVALTSKIQFNNEATTVWLDQVLNLLIIAYFMLVTGLLILEHNRLSPGAIGLVTAYMLPLPRVISYSTQITSWLKTNMVSMERVHQLVS